MKEILYYPPNTNPMASWWDRFAAGYLTPRIAGDVVALGDGTALLPTYTFLLDFDTGMYRVGANQLGFTAQGAQVAGIYNDAVADQILLVDRNCTNPAYSFLLDRDTGMYRGGNDQVLMAAGAAIVCGFYNDATANQVVNTDGSDANPSYSFLNERDTGIFRVGANELGFAASAGHVASIYGNLATERQIRLVDGVVTRPAYSFLNDTNLGFYRVGVDIIGVALANALDFQFSPNTFTGLAGSSMVMDTMTIATGSITDSSGAISFGNEALTTTGAMTANSFITASDIGIAADTDLIQLTADTMVVNGWLGINITPTAAIDIVSGVDNANTLMLTDITTNNANKDAFVTVRHYVNVEEPLAIFHGRGESAKNRILIGGTHLDTTFNVATDIEFYTASNNTTTVSSTNLKLAIRNNGYVGISETTPVKLIHAKVANDIGLLLQNYSNTAGHITGIQFRCSTGAGDLYSKGAIIFERSGTLGRGKLHFCNDIAGDTASVTVADSKMHITTGGNVYTENNIQIASDTNGLVLGAGQDMSAIYNGTAGVINTSLIAPSDLDITCGANKTIELQNTVTEDLQFTIHTGKVPAANYPTWEAFSTNTGAYAFSVDDYIDCESNEIPHFWKEATTGHLHLHFSNKTIQNTGADRFVKFTIWLTMSDMAEVFAETSYTAEFTIPTATAALTHLYLDMGDIDFSTYKIGAQIVPRVKRIAATGGTEYADDVYIHQVGIHLEKDTMGSRNELTK